jgi:superfamily II DNA or RNA helicase
MDNENNNSGVVELELDNMFVTVRNMTKDDENALWSRLAFKVEVFGSPEPRWRHLYNRRTKKTYAGLCGEVATYCKEQGLPYKVIDTRVRHKPNADFHLVEEIDTPDGKVPLELRPYQKDVVAAARARDVLQAATGAGKTVMLAALIAKFNVKPVAVFADKITLCEQLRSEFEKFLGIKVGLVGGGMDTQEDVTVYSLQSATEDMVKDAKLIMFDECHHIPADTCMNVCTMAKDAFYRIGVSATPWRDAGDDMLIDAALNKRKPELAITASKLIEGGYLVPPSIYFVPVKQQFTGRNYQKVYTQAVIENQERNMMIRKVVKQMFIRNKHILVLVQQVKHGEILKDMITQALGGEQVSTVQVTKRNGQQVLVRVPMVEFMNGSDDATRRQAVLQAVKEEKCRVLIATVIADEGLDLPILDTLVLAGGGKSSTRAFQRVGRVLRVYPGKKKAIVFDFEDFTPMLRRHARVRRKLYKTEPAWEIGKFNVSPYDN